MEAGRLLTAADLEHKSLAFDDFLKWWEENGSQGIISLRRVARAYHSAPGRKSGGHNTIFQGQFWEIDSSRNGREKTGAHFRLTPGFYET